VRLAGLAALLLCASACGGQAESASRSEDPPAKTVTASEDERGATSYGLMTLVHADEESIPPHEVYRAFRDAQTPTDDAAFVYLSDFDRTGHFGRLRPETTRLLQADLPGEPDELVAALTTTGDVCYSLSPDGGGSCGKVGANGFMLSGQDDKGGILVYGLVGDGVTGVGLVVGGRRYAARVGNNSYAALIEGSFDALSSVVLHRGRSESETILLP
jgi:hypothetical protein